MTQATSRQMQDFDIRKAVAGAIRATGDPTAAIKLQDCHSAASKVGKMLVSMTTMPDVQTAQWKLLREFTQEELDKANPALIVALCCCLTEALVRQGRKFGGDPTV